MENTKTENVKNINGEKKERKRIYPEKLSQEHLDGVAEIEKFCFSSPWSRDSLGLLTKDGIGVGMVCRADGKIVAYGGMLCVEHIYSSVQR